MCARFKEWNNLGQFFSRVISRPANLRATSAYRFVGKNSTARPGFITQTRTQGHPRKFKVKTQATKRPWGTIRVICWLTQVRTSNANLSHVAPGLVYSEALPFTGTALAVFCLGALACIATSPPEGLSRVSESLALKGYCRTDCWPVVLSETSTRRLLAHTITWRLPSILRRSSALSSGLSSISFLTWSGVRLSSSPRDRVSMLADGTPWAVRKALVRSTRRWVSSWLYVGVPRWSACPCRIR